MKDKPAYEKIVIGSLMALTEGIVGGNMLESAKIVRQSTQQTYYNSLRGLYTRGGLYGLLYTGYFPAGAFQSITKGLPILFVQGEVSQIAETNGINKRKAALIGGMCGGFVQGIIVTPTQRLRSLALTNTTCQSSIPFMSSVIKQEGIKTIMRGASAMCSRRAIDWGLRFGSMEYIRTELHKYSGEKKAWHTIAGGFLGGSISALTLPLDCLIAQSQKSGSTGNPIEVARKMYVVNGVAAFTRGLFMRVLHSGYHTLFIAGFGTLIYEKWYASQT